MFHEGGHGKDLHDVGVLGGQVCEHKLKNQVTFPQTITTKNHQLLCQDVPFLPQGQLRQLTHQPTEQSSDSLPAKTTSRPNISTTFPLKYFVEDEIYFKMGFEICLMNLVKI